MYGIVYPPRDSYCRARVDVGLSVGTSVTVSVSSNKVPFASYVCYL